MDISEIRDLISDDMQAVNKLILHRLESDVVLINQVGHYIVNSGGKRLRPMLVVLSARACGYTGEQHIDLAAVIEFIHTATLLHDDVVDGSDLRRNKETANALWGNEASVLVGDFLYSRAFEMMVDVNIMRVMELMSHSTNRIAEGEVLQLLNCNDPDTTEEKYLEVIKRKTATLFEAGTRLGGILTHSDPDTEQAIADYGLHLGIAFQLVDDALDYSSSNDTLGKNVGDDLAEGKPTLPLIQAMKAGAPQQRDAIRHAIESGGRENIDKVLKAIESTNAMQYTASLAQEEAQRAKEALNILPSSAYKEALRELADYSVRRTY
jgi:octaprenyl-diphosphate synthase